MRLLVLACVIGCGPSAAPVPFAVPVRPSPAPPAIQPAPAMPVDTVEGPTSTPGRHPRIPRDVRSTRDLDAAAIRRVMRQHMAPVVACYEQLSPRDRRRVVIQFTIGPTGTVLRSSASGPQGALENCIAAAFAETTFEPPVDGGSVTVTYPVQFRPG